MKILTAFYDAVNSGLFSDKAFSVNGGEISDFNVFKVLKVDRFEIRHSNMLGWLLDPSETHGLGTLFLQEFLCAINAAKTLTTQYVCGRDNLTPIDKLTEARLADFKVLREADYKDIELFSEENRVVVVIENKWNAKERGSTVDKVGQLMTYRDKVDQDVHYEGWTKIFVFLTPTGLLPSEENRSTWEVLSYREVMGILENEKLRTRLKDQNLNAQKIFIDQYVSILKQRRDMLKADDLVVQKCFDIYREHKDAIDMIEEVIKGMKDRSRGIACRIINQCIESAAREKDSKILLCNPPNGRLPSFFTSGMNDFLPPLEEGPGSWNGTLTNYYYWYEVKLNPIKPWIVGYELCLEFGGMGLRNDDERKIRMARLYAMITGKEFKTVKKGEKERRWHQTWNWNINSEVIYDIESDDGKQAFAEAIAQSICTAVQKENAAIDAYRLKYS